MPRLPLHRAEEFIEPLNAALAEFEISTLARRAAFLAQIGHESGDLRYWREMWGPTPAQKRYEGRADLGNTEPGDGFKFRGRGPLQVTGRANYQRVGEELGIDLLNHPDLLELPEEGFRSAGLFWKEHRLNEIADSDNEPAFRVITKVINGGFNGWDDRLARWRRAREVFGLV